MPHEAVHFLLVEDDQVDIMAFQRALQTLKIANPLHFARDGVEALEMLRGEAGGERLPRPYVIILDLNMPRMSGMEFLEELRRDPELRTSIVFVLTTSSDEEDILRAHQRHVAGYIVKSQAEQTVLKALAMLDHYWRVVELA